MFRRRKRSFQNDTMFILAGAAIGGVLGLLYAPKRGVELRNDIKGELDNSLNQIRSGSLKLKNEFVNRAGNVLNTSREYVGNSYQSTAGLILNEITSLRKAFNSAVETYKYYKQKPEEPLQRQRTNDVFTKGDIIVNDEDLPKFEGMGRRQE
jgi:gas vesicle protein